MSVRLPLVHLARHGETAWSLAGRHTGRNDLPLTERGERQARTLGKRLAGMSFAAVFTSPLQRATRTCLLAGFGDRAVTDPDLMEWDYGTYEGRTAAEIQSERPGWLLFRDGCPGGESPAQVEARADRVVERLRAREGNTLVLAHGHLLRVLAARWLGLPAVTLAPRLLLGTAAVSALGYDHDRSRPALHLWNEEEAT